MNYETFLEKIEESNILIGFDSSEDFVPFSIRESLQEYITHQVPCKNKQGYKNVKKLENKFDFIIQVWKSKEASGGNCWGDEAEESYYGSENEPQNFESLDKILQLFCPNIPYLTAKKIISLYKEDSNIDYEYYGNYTEYTYHYIKLCDLHEFLSENNLFSE